MKLVASAVQGDADVCNALDVPVAGVSAGGGKHVTIPADFVTQVSSGKPVPGCTYAAIDATGSLFVTDVVIAKVANATEVSKLSPTLQTEAAALQTKLATAVVVNAAKLTTG